MNTFELDESYIAHTYKRFPVEIVSGKGSLVKDASGKEYIDMGSGIAVTSFGVADDAWIAAVEEQIHSVQHMSNLYYTAPCAKLAEALCVRTGMSRVRKKSTVFCHRRSNHIGLSSGLQTTIISCFSN